MKKTLIALLPALLVQIGIFFIPKGSGGAFWFWFLLAGLAVGGVISAVFVMNALKEKKPGKSGIFYGFMAVLVFVGYVATFFFTGCLLAITQGN